VYVSVVYVNKNLNIQEKIKKKHSVENNLYSRSETSNLECNVFSKTIFILEQFCLLDNVCCPRLKICYQLIHNAAGLVVLT